MLVQHSIQIDSHVKEEIGHMHIRYDHHSKMILRKMCRAQRVTVHML